MMARDPDRSEDWPTDGGEMGALIRRFDWSATSLGPKEGWPQSRRTVIDLLLRSPVPIVTLWGGEGVMIYNDAYSVFAGGRHPRLLGSPVLDGWPEVADFNRRVMEVGMKGGTLSFGNQHLVLHRHDVPEDVWMDLDYSPILDEAGRPAGVLAIVAETTGRVAGERRLETLRELDLRRSTTSVEDAVRAAIGVLSERNTDIPFALAYLCEGMDEMRLVASCGVRPRHDIRHLDLRSRHEEWAACMARVRHTGMAEALVALPLLEAPPVRTASGRAFVLPLRAADATVGLLIAGKSASVRPDPDYAAFFDLVAAQISGAIGTARALHAERHRAKHLEQQVAAALAERAAAEAQLHQAQKMDAIGKLTGGVAHDFNNLLQIVGGNLQLLSRDITGNEQAEQRVRNALAGVSRGSRLASQLLAFARKQPLEPKVVNLGRFIRGLDDMLRRALGEGIEIETVIAGGLWNTMVDPGLVENALLNLAINARDAMDGHGRLTIEAGNAFLDEEYARAHTDVAAGQYVMLAVTDTGCGVAPEVLERVFEPFFTTKPEGQGTGLGLSMVYGFVKQSGGHVKIYSEPGQGTTIRLYLPRARQEEAPVAVAPDTEPPRGGTETVLVVEDDAAVRGTVVEMLLDLGYRVLTAGDAQSALAIVESGGHIDLLFTDVVMPGPLRSPELARRARELIPGIAVLFTSGYTENAIVHGGRLDEGVNLLSKPYTREALARKIRQVLGGERQRAADGAAGPAARPSARPSPASARPPAAASPEAGAALRVLIVEDDVFIRQNTADMLERLGHRVVKAANAEDAVSALQMSGFDVLVTDLGLPGTSGAELAIQARGLDTGLGIVFATGCDQVDGWAEEAPGTPPILVRKPYDMQTLARALQASRPCGPHRD